jgi:RNA polymerase sigma factor (sigma-70 family)
MRAPGAMRLLSDDRLTRRAADGDRRALSAIYGRYHQSLYRYSLAIVGNPQDAQDALQNTMLKVLRALPGEQRRIELKPWLYRIAHNEAIELLRRRRETEQLDPQMGSGEPGLAERVEVRQRLGLLIADLDQLPERQRGALVMRELAGLDFATIGAALETSPAVARQTVYEARLSLRQMATGREMTCEAVTRALSDADGRITRRRDIRAHLRDCAGCRDFREEIEARQHDLAALSPLPAVAAAGLLGGQGGAGGGGLAAALGGGAAKTLGASAAIKSAAAVAVVAAVGVTAADRGDLVRVGPIGSGSEEAQTQQPPAVGAPARQSAGSAPGEPGAGGAAAHALERRRAVAEARTAGGGAGLAAEAANPGAPASAAENAPVGPGQAQEKGALPAASAHGQQTAAGHKGGRGQGSRGQGNRGHGRGGSSNSHPPPKPAPPAPSASGGGGTGAVNAPPPPKPSAQPTPNQPTTSAPEPSQSQSQPQPQPVPKSAQQQVPPTPETGAQP